MLHAMPRTDFSAMPCSVARTLEVIGERWSLLIVRDAFYGLRRFEEFQADLGIARNILTDRLRKLVNHGVFETVAYEERPPRHEYRLTDKGRDLLPVVLAMMAWGDRWESGDDGAPVTLTHETCGADGVRARVCCDGCGQPLELGEVRVDPVRVVGARRVEPSLAPS